MLYLNSVASVFDSNSTLKGDVEMLMCNMKYRITENSELFCSKDVMFVVFNFLGSK